MSIPVFECKVQNQDVEEEKESDSVSASLTPASKQEEYPWSGLHQNE